jgi:hypothetical protein
MSKKNLLSLVSFLFAGFSAFEGKTQEKYETLFILDIAPDARSAGMGDIGAATSPDAMSQKWNASKHIFADLKYGVSLSYTPWLSKISRGLNMGLISGYIQFNEKSAIGASATYLSIGDINLFSADKVDMGTVSSDQFAIDASYSHRLGEHFSGGVTLRYANTFKIKQTGTPNSGVLRSVSAFSGDISFFYTRPVYVFGKDTELAFGTVVSNLGTKVEQYEGVEALMPMNWRLGVTWNVPLDPKNTLSPSFDINKSLVPLNYSQDVTVIEAMGKSFGGGREFTWSAGAEYSYNKLAMLRLGYRHSKNHEGFRYFTFGAGLVYKALKLDASYLLSTSPVTTPLSNTFRLTLSFIKN